MATRGMNLTVAVPLPALPALPAAMMMNSGENARVLIYSRPLMLPV